MIPGPWPAALLALAAYRLTRLVGWDTLTRPIRVRLTHRSEIDGTVYIDRHGTPGGGYRPMLDEWIHCPWCVGFWVSIAVSVAWWEWPRATLATSVPFALSAIVGLVAKNLDE